MRSVLPTRISVKSCGVLTAAVVPNQPYQPLRLVFGVSNDHTGWEAVDLQLASQPPERRMGQRGGATRRRERTAMHRLKSSVERRIISPSSKDAFFP